ncbi:MAG: cation:proton antiporter [Anaerolineaceae bacterium]
MFKVSLYILWKHFHYISPLFLGLATLGVLLAAGISAFRMYYLAGWEWSSAAIFGTLIAATEPVAIITAIKDARIKGHLHLLLEAESLYSQHPHPDWQGWNPPQLQGDSRSSQDEKQTRPARWITWF